MKFNSPTVDGWIDMSIRIVKAVPLAGVTWFEADKYCAEAGKRLCGVYEWEQACSGDGQTFSMGGHYVKGGCALELNDPQPSGAMSSCRNGYGLHDMSGGVWEWTATNLRRPYFQLG